MHSAVAAAASDVIGQSARRTRLPDHRHRPEPVTSGRQLDTAEFHFRHAAALALGARGRRSCSQPNPFCHARPVKYRPCDAPATAAASRPSLSPEQLFDRARDAFRRGRYEQSLQAIDRAIELLPEDADLLQFRSLCLFAMGEYPLAAAAAYTALSLGPGWNWETLYAFYGEVGPYQGQLNELASATGVVSASAEHYFLLAYHCLMLGHLEAGRKNLERVLERQPDEALTRSLLDMLPAR
jgi:tetratricopeptide (TPR) repeat protein